MKTMKTVRKIIHHRYVVVIVALIAISSLCPAAPSKRSRGSRDTWQQPVRVVNDLGLKEGASVADVGCGSGYFTFRLSKVVGETGKVFATEISDKGLKAVADKAKKDNIKNIETIKSDPQKTKLTACSVDAAIIVNVLHHVKKEDRIPLVKDIATAIKPDGSFFILDWRMKAPTKHDKNNRIPRDELIGYAEKAGLKLDAEFFYLTNQVFLRFSKPAAKPAEK